MRPGVKQLPSPGSPARRSLPRPTPQCSILLRRFAHQHVVAARAYPHREKPYGCFYWGKRFARKDHADERERACQHRCQVHPNLGARCRCKPDDADPQGRRDPLWMGVPPRPPWAGRGTALMYTYWPASTKHTASSCESSCEGCSSGSNPGRNCGGLKPSRFSRQLDEALVPAAGTGRAA